MEQKLLDILACPKCKGDLELKGDHLICNKCMLVYKIDEGIPVMLLDEAEGLGD